MVRGADQRSSASPSGSDTDMVTPNGPDDRGEKDVHEEEPTGEHGELPRNERGEQWRHGEQDGELDEQGVRREPRRMPGGVQRSVIGPTGD